MLESLRPYLYYRVNDYSFLVLNSTVSDEPRSGVCLNPRSSTDKPDSGTRPDGCYPLLSSGSSNGSCGDNCYRFVKTGFIDG
jgi:hypothetical protein